MAYINVKNEKLISKNWPDMDLIFAIQGSEVFFTGSPPSDIESYVKRNVMALGVSAINFSKKHNKKKNTLIVSKRGPNELKELASVLETFNQRFCAPNPRFDLRTEDVEHILEKSNWQADFDEDGLPTQLVKDSDLKPQKGHLKKLHVSKLLALLRAITHAEILELSYEYLTMHRFCWRLLGAVNNACKERLTKMYGPDYLEHEYQLPFVVGYVMSVAANTKEMASLFKVYN